MRTRSNPESGYAMLLVFALAACVAITLYQQLPRAAFEAQREKESLCIDHGEQYKRAVQLYVRKFGRYPAKMEDLDNTSQVRFLRKHYFDPLTGKEEWRLLHMGNNGKLIDSKIDSGTDDQWHAGSITEFKSAASSDANDFGPTNANVGLRKRPSDDNDLGPMGGNAPVPANNQPPALSMASGATQPGALQPGALQPGAVQPGALQPGGTGNPNPSLNPNGPGNGANLGQLNRAVPGLPPGLKNVGTTGSASSFSTNQNNPGSSAPGGSVSGNGGYGSGSISGNGGFPDPTRAGNQTNSQTQGQATTPYPTAPGSNMNINTGFGNPGQTTGGASPAQMINNLLTSPRPGGAPQGVGGAVGMVVGGLAGVASTYKGHGIRHYNDQEEYQKWEFFYDAGKEYGNQNVPNLNQQQQQQTGGMNNSNLGQGSGFGQNSTGTGTFGGSGTGTFGGSGTGTFGGSTGTGSFGGSSGFGQGSTGTTNGQPNTTAVPPVR
jgi:hypothetical protein